MKIIKYAVFSAYKYTTSQFYENSNDSEQTITLYSTSMAYTPTNFTGFTLKKYLTSMNCQGNFTIAVMK